MHKKTMICSVLCVIFIVTMVIPVFAVPSESPTQVKSYFAKPASPPGLTKPPKPNNDAVASVDIRNIASGETLMGQVLVIAEVKGDFDSVVLEANDISEEMTQVGTTSRYQITWTAGSVGGETLTVNALTGENVVGSDSVTVNVVNTYQAVLLFEIDYLAGHAPTSAVISYITGYWNSRAIDVTLKLDDVVADPTPDGIINDSDFWNLESNYNDIEMVDDRAGGDLYNGKFDLMEKWILYGSWASSSNLGGSTWVLNDGSAGNYILIADSMIDSWEAGIGIADDGGEVTVLSHEMGHSIGVLVTRGRKEKYDPDIFSVMSTMTPENSKYMSGCWYYSKEY